MTNKVFLAVLVLLLLTGSVNAEEIFNYVKNPTANDLSTFNGLSGDTISTTTTAKRGYFYLQTYVKDVACAGRDITIPGLFTIDANIPVKGYASCYNLTPTIVVKVAVDNRDYGLVPRAKIGDYNSYQNHITVIPYSFNAWVNVDHSSTQNLVNMNRMFREQERDPTFKKLDPSKRGDIGNWVLDEGTFLPLFEWKINKKNGVCSAEIIEALDNPNTYYSNPNDLFIPGYGLLTDPLSDPYNECRNLMFPPTGTKDRVNAMVNDYEHVLNSLYYNEQIQYESYPFVIKDVQIKCYKNGTLVGWDDISTPSSVVGPGGIIGQQNPNTFNFISSYSATEGTQTYSWTRTRNKFSIPSPANIELLQKDFELKCPTGTNYYTASVGIVKNGMYRHKSPMDATWDWSNVFNITSGSSFDTMFSKYKKSEALMLTQTGELAIIPSQTPQNQTYSSNQNPDKNKINETSSQGYYTGKNGTYQKSDNDGGSSQKPCIDCEQNITGYGSNSTAANSGAGVQSGGSSIDTGIDDSAVSGLITQSVGENRINQKQDFVDKLIEIGVALLTTIILFYSVFALFGIIFFFISCFKIPIKMKESVRELFNAGLGK